jgi:two-component system nitrate/nitrite response regulator NarL
MPSNLAEFLPTHPNLGLSPGTSQSMKQAGLSLREIEILACLVSGQPNKIISRQLEISEATVKIHVKAILRKVGVQNRTQAAIWAIGERLNETLSSHPPCGNIRNGADRALP